MPKPIYYHTAYTDRALAQWCEMHDKVPPCCTSQKEYYLKHYGPEIKAVEEIIKLNEL